LNSLLRNMMAQMESWEAATEFGIPETELAQYGVRRRANDVYIACLASIFDVLRVENREQQEIELAALAKTLILYSRSSAARYLRGVEKHLNQVYSSALYYLAGLPATATLLARNLDGIDGTSEEECFLQGFLGRRVVEKNVLSLLLSNILQTDTTAQLDDLHGNLSERVRSGLHDDPRKFIAAKLALACALRFKETNVWDALRQHAAGYTTDAWRPFFGNTQAFPLWELLPSQMTAIRAGLLSDDDETMSLQMPTSAGKTALCELLIYHEVKIRNRRVLFLVPFRALAAEIRDGMSQRLASAGVRVIASHGGNIPTRSETATVENADVLIVTPEKFTALAQVLPTIENQYRTVICDEGHLIDDDTRGLQYELLLTKLRGTDTEPRKVVFISAVLPNVDEIHQWLGGRPEHLAQSTYRPVETDYAFLTPQPRHKDSWQLDFNPLQARPRSYFLLRFLMKDDFRYLNPVTDRFKLIQGWQAYTSLAAATAIKASRHGSVALFTTSRGDNGIRGLSNKVMMLYESNARVTGSCPPLSNKLPDLQEFIGFQFGPEYTLTRLLKYGTGFHHGMLPQEVRRAMEDGIQNGSINILLCTTTLAEGVNLPIRTLVMHTVRRYNGRTQQWEYLPNRTIKNIIGRAGRAGKETRGRVVFVNETERNRILNVLRDAGMESAHGALYRLVKAINAFVKQHHIPLQNDVFDKQEPWFIALIDGIDFSLLDLIPPETEQQDINQHVDELLQRTLASRYCNTPELQDCLHKLFRLRAEYLQQSVTRETWPVLRKSGASPRLWRLVVESHILDHPLWKSLSNPLDEEWLKVVILQLLGLSGIETEPKVFVTVLCQWMSGSTYGEMADVCGGDVDTLLEIICRDLSYRLQDHAAKLCQLAMEQHGDQVISETARHWSSLLQYGLGSLQQLDLFERGCTERLAVWGISRHLSAKSIDLRGSELLQYLRDNGEEVTAALLADNRVPKMSFERFCQELRIR